MPEWVEWTVAQIDTRDAFELTAVVPAGSVRVLPAGGRLGAGRAPPDLPALRVGGHEGVRSASCHARHRPVTDLLWADDVRGCRPARRGRVVPAGRSHLLERSGSAVRRVGDRSHGRRPAGERAEPLLGAARAARQGHYGRCRSRRRFRASDCRRLGACRSTVAGAHARRSGMGLCTPRAAQPAVAPARRRPPSTWRWTRRARRGLPAPAVTVGHAARTAVRGVAAKSRTAWRRGEWFVAVRARAADGRVRGAAARTCRTPPGATSPTRSRSRSTAATSCLSRITRTPPAGR